MSKTEIHELGKSAAESVFAYIARTAEKVDEGIRWQTLAYDNQPNYNYSIFNGVAGISLFLADYFRLTGDERARELALGGLRWCNTQQEEGYDRGLYIGRTSVAMAWLHLADATGDSALAENAGPNAEILLREDPGPVTDILGGASGNGLFLLRLWEAAGDERYLRGATRNGEWLASRAIRDEQGCYWPMWTGTPEPWYATGFAHGISGVAYFLLRLWEATGEERWQELAREVIETLDRNAIPDHGGLNWAPSLGADEPERCQWCHGAPGIGLLYVKAHEALKDPEYLKTAEAAGETTFAYGDIRQNPSQCHGLAGNAELFVDLYRSTGNAIWLERAADFARRAFAYRTADPEGEKWQADEQGFYSPDFMCGAAGTGHFFLRLWAPERLRMPLS